MVLLNIIGATRYMIHGIDLSGATISRKSFFFNFSKVFIVWMSDSF